MEGAFYLGDITTGRQRVFVGVFITIFNPSGAHFTGEDAYCFLRALRAAGAGACDEKPKRPQPGALKPFQAP